MTSRYEGPGRRGASRVLTAEEHRNWQATSATWHSAPPWTEAVLADNAAVQQALIDLYEDGVALATLADAAGWNQPKTAGVLHRARLAGMGTGSRRYIAPEPKPAKESFRRTLTEVEATDLTERYDLLPRHASGTARGWNCEAGLALAAVLAALVEDKVALGTLGEHLGMSRQAVHNQVTRHHQRSADASAA